MALVASIVSWSMFLLGVVLLTALLMRRWFRYFRVARRENRAPLTRPSRPVTATTRSLSDAPEDVLRWQVEMHETARQLKGELDSKMRALQILIRQSREQAERLEQLLQRCGDGSNPSAASGSESDVPPPSPTTRGRATE
jgi:hypothetical protein